MRVLSVRQPWAWAIVHGGKDVENRSRNLAGAYRGPVAIQVAQREDVNAFSLASETIGALDAAADAWLGTLTPEEATRLYTAPWWKGQGSIIGVVDLVDVHNPADRLFMPTADLDGVGCSPWAEDGAFHLVLANPRPLREPFPWKGALGLRELPREVEAEILRRAS